MVLIIIIRDFSITGFRAYADYKGHSFPTSRYAQWKTFIQMVFLYYLLAVYVGQSFNVIYKGNERTFAILLNPEYIYYTMLAVTLITIHSGVSYIYRGRFLIQNLLKNEN